MQGEKFRVLEAKEFVIKDLKIHPSLVRINGAQRKTSVDEESGADFRGWLLSVLIYRAIGVGGTGFFFRRYAPLLLLNNVQRQKSFPLIVRVIFFRNLMWY